MFWKVTISFNDTAARTQHFRATLRFWVVFGSVLNPKHNVLLCNFKEIGKTFLSLDQCQNLMGSFLAHASSFHQILWKSIQP